MNISYNWLREYVDLDLEPGAVGEVLTMLGLEVDGIETIGPSLEGVVVGHVLEVQPHPNADRLTLCRVDLGDGEPVQIVCGAPNVAAGQYVPVATVGTTLHLPDRKNPAERVAVTIKSARLRGETSEGMICAEDELGLSDDHSGIMVLDGAATAGEPFRDYLARQGVSVQDTVYDVAITPNRPDAVSHIGVARDLAARLGKPLRKPAVELPEDGGAVAEQVTVRIEAPEACPRYVAMRVRGVTVQESPAWLQQRLRAVGLRPINNIVDVTNYVMYECGQPLHAFDVECLAGRSIVVREAGAGERFTTLDGKERLLPEGALMICDTERMVAIAGVMGGENSEVTDRTTDVLIESAYFDPASIRRTARALGMQTDASYRFERGVDPEGQVWAAARAAALMAELGGGRVEPGVVDAHPNPIERRAVRLRRGRLTQMLGVEVPVGDVEAYLTALGFELTPEGAVSYWCTVPSFRPDIEREVDVIEEVARLYGYDRIPEPDRIPIPNQVPREAPEARLRRRSRTVLLGRGFREVYVNSLLRRDVAERFNQPVLRAGRPAGAIVETLKPISQEMAALRPSLLPGVLQILAHNQNHGQDVLRFMEFGHVFVRADEAGAPVPGYAEHTALLLALSGPDTPVAWDRAPRAVDFFDLKGAVEDLLDALRLPDVTMTPVYDATPVTAYHLEVRAGDVRLGIVARLAEAVQEAYDLREPVYFAELDWDALVDRAAERLEPAYQPVSRFPVVSRDLAVLVDRDQPAGPLLAAIREAGGALLLEATVFDLYQGDRLEPGKKSLAFALRFGADRTLTDREVDACVQGIVAVLEQRFGARLRQ